jgi:hypothetical protein
VFGGLELVEYTVKIVVQRARRQADCIVPIQRVFAKDAAVAVHGPAIEVDDAQLLA